MITISSCAGMAAAFADGGRQIGFRGLSRFVPIESKNR
jgi:hypothetical protein